MPANFILNIYPDRQPMDGGNSLTALPAPKRMSGMAESFSGKLAGITLPDPEGKSTRLGSLWEKGPAVLVFLRHYG